MDDDADKTLAVVDIPAEAAAFVETDADDQLDQEQQHDVGLRRRMAVGRLATT